MPIEFDFGTLYERHVVNGQSCILLLVSHRGDNKQAEFLIHTSMWHIAIRRSNNGTLPTTQVTQRRICYHVFCCSCVLLLVLSCLVCNCCWMTVCIFVVVLCVLLSYVYLLYCVDIAFFFTLDAGLLARSQYSEGPATGHLDTGFSWFPCA